MNAAEIPSTVEQLVQVVNLQEDRIAALEATVKALTESAGKPGRVRLDLPPKTCVMCGIEFLRRSDEPASNYRARMTCGSECRSAYLSQLRKGSVQPVEPRACKVCGGEIPRGSLQPSVYAKRVTCSRDCQRAVSSQVAQATQARLRREKAGRLPPAERRRAARELERIAKPSKVVPPRTPEEAWTVAARVVRDYRGMPLLVEDVAELTGMGRDRARRTLDLLVAGGVLAARVVDGNVSVWFDPAVERAA